MKIKIIPYCSYKIETSLSMQECFMALVAQVEPDKWYLFPPFSTSPKIFIGKVSLEEFTIFRKWSILERNAFRPTIHGTFEPASKGTIITITMTMNLFVIVFCLIGLAILFAVLIIFFGSFLAGEIKRPWNLSFLSVFFVCALIVNSGFWLEVNKVKPVLSKIFKAKV